MDRFDAERDQFIQDMCAATRIAAVKQINALHGAIQGAKNEF